MANEMLIFLACNIYNIWAEYSLRSLHSGERCGRVASGFLSKQVFVFGRQGEASDDYFRTQYLSFI